MLPQKTNKKSGGSFGRAASGAINRRDAARAEELRMLGRGLAFMGCAIILLVFSAPDLWPHLFPR
jgi:hypothetical protein